MPHNLPQQYRVVDTRVKYIQCTCNAITVVSNQFPNLSLGSCGTLTNEFLEYKDVVVLRFS